MICKIITLFPEFFNSPLCTGLLGKAIESKLITVELINLRDYTEDKYRKCDDYPYGGGSGMVLLPEPLQRSIIANRCDDTKIIMTSASGKLLTQQVVKELSQNREICIICGHYEGVDQRIIDQHVDYEISIGDYVLSGGEYAALVILDTMARYVPGFMSNQESLIEESFETDLLEYPQYTRPALFDGLTVPGVLLGGNHADISKWRHEQSIEKTRTMRPELYKHYLIRKLRGE